MPHLVSCNVPSDDDSFYAWVEQAYRLPSNLWLPKINVKATIAAFANEQGWKIYDASQMFNVLCKDASKVDIAIQLLSQRSLQKQDTLHIVCMSEFNVEAMQILSLLFQLKDYREGRTDVITIDKYLLHCICVFRGESVRLHDIHDATLVRTLLTQIENDAECMICLKDLYKNETVLPFACGHPICSECFYSSCMKSCAKCRTCKPWKSQRYMHLHDEVKKAAHAGSVIEIKEV